MNEIAIHLRLLYLFQHNLHNTVSRIAFFSDHEYLSGAYEESLDAYDGVIERMIGKDMNPDLVMIQVMAVEKLKKLPSATKDNTEAFNILLALEQELCQLIEKYVIEKKPMQGCLQLIGDIANASEVRIYKLKRRTLK